MALPTPPYGCRGQASGWTPSPLLCLWQPELPLPPPAAGAATPPLHPPIAGLTKDHLAAGVQLSTGFLLLFAAVGWPAAWVELSLPSAMLSPVYACKCVARAVAPAAPSLALAHR